MSVHEVKVCLLGDSGVGKSSIVHRFVYDAFKPAMESTIGAAFLTKTMVVEGNTYKYQIWDTAGQEKYRALAPMYYRGAAAAIIVYDITREDSFEAMKSWMNELKKHASSNIVIAIAGNKQDLEDLREVSYKTASLYSDEQKTVFVETSAKTAVNIPALFMEISKKLSMTPDFDSAQSTVTGSITITGQQSPSKRKEKRTCCS